MDVESRREEVLERLKRNGTELQFEDECWRSDEQIVLIAVSRNHESFQFASTELRNDESFVWRAVKTNYKVLKFVSDDLKRDTRFMLKCVMEHRVDALKFACDTTLTSDREFMMSCIRVHGASLQFASDRLRADKDVVIAAIENNGYLKYAALDLRNDREFVRRCVRIKPRSIEHVGEELENDQQFILSVLQANGKCWKFIPSRYTKDEQFMSEAIRQACKSTSKALRQHIHHSLRQNFLFLWELVKVNADNYTLYASKSFRKQRRLFALKCIELHGASFVRGLPKELRHDRQFMRRAVKIDRECLQFAPTELRTNDEFIKDINNDSPLTDDTRFRWEVEQVLTDAEGKLNLERLDEIWRSDEQVILMAVQRDRSSLRFIGKQLNENKQCILQCMSVSDGWALQYASTKWRDDNDVVFAAVKCYWDGAPLQYASDRLRNDKDFVMRCVRERTRSLKYASSEYVKTGTLSYWS